MILGVPLERYKKIPTRRTTLFAMDAGDLKRQMQADRAEVSLPMVPRRIDPAAGRKYRAGGKAGPCEPTDSAPPPTHLCFLLLSTYPPRSVVCRGSSRSSSAQHLALRPPVPTIRWTASVLFARCLTRGCMSMVPGVGLCPFAQSSVRRQEGSSLCTRTTRTRTSNS